MTRSIAVALSCEDSRATSCAACSSLLRAASSCASRSASPSARTASGGTGAGGGSGAATAPAAGTAAAAAAAAVSTMSQAGVRKSFFTFGSLGLSARLVGQGFRVTHLHQRSDEARARLLQGQQARRRRLIHALGAEQVIDLRDAVLEPGHGRTGTHMYDGGLARQARQPLFQGGGVRGRRGRPLRGPTAQAG